MKKIAVLNGPNLDRLGKREPAIYGRATLKDLEGLLRAQARSLGVSLTFFQSNHEGALIDKLGELADRHFDGIIINPGGLSHTSIALRDAIAGTGLGLSICKGIIESHDGKIWARNNPDKGLTVTFSLPVK